MEVLIYILYICVDSGVDVIVTTAIDIIAMLDFLLLFVPQLWLNSDSCPQIDTIAAVGNSQAERVLAGSTGFYQ